MKKNVGLRNNINQSNKRTSLLPKSKKFYDELTTPNNLKENQIKIDDLSRYNHLNKSIDAKINRNKEKKNNKNKKIIKLSNKSSLSRLKEINNTEEQKDNSNFNRPQGYINNNNFKNNSLLLSNTENIYNETNIDKEEFSKNQNSRKYKNGSCCNIKVNKPTKLILDKNMILNEMSIYKSLKINKNYTSVTHKTKNDLNKTFNSQDKVPIISHFKFNNKTKQKNDNDQILLIKENINNIKNKNEDKNLKKINSNNSTNNNKNKSLHRFNTENSLSYKRENSNQNEINRARMKSIDNIDKLNLNNKIKKKNLKLTSNQTDDLNDTNKRLLSPIFTNFDNFQNKFVIETPDNNTYTEDITHMDLLKLSMKELFLEKKKLIDEISDLKLEKKDNLDKKELFEQIDSMKNILKENENKLKNYEVLKAKNEDLTKKIKIYERIYENKTPNLSRNNRLLENKKLKNTIGDKNKTSDGNNELNDIITTMKNKIQTLNEVNRKNENEKKELNKRIKDLEKNNYNKKKRIEEVEKELRKTEKLKKNREEKINELEKDIEKKDNEYYLENKNNSKKVEDLNNKINNLEKEKNDDGCIINELNETINYLKSKINEYHKQIEEKEGEDKLKVQINSLEKELKNKNVIIKELNIKIKQIEDDIENRNKQHSQLIEQKKGLEESHKNEINLLNEKIKKLKEENEEKNVLIKNSD